MKKYVLMLGLIASFNAMAEIVTGDKCGDDCSWTFDTDTGKLTVSGTGDMYDYLWDYPWVDYQQNIKTVDIQEGITKIGYSALSSLSNMESVNLPLSLSVIGTDAMSYAQSLTSIIIPDSVQRIDKGAFYTFPIGDERYTPPTLQSVVIGTSVESIGDFAFTNQTSLESVFIPDNLQYISDSAFARNQGSVTLYCASENLCSISGVGDIKIYTKENGVYKIDNNYYSTPENMLADKTCNQIDGTCQTEAETYKNAKAELMAGSNLCITKKGCLKLMDMAQSGNYCTTLANCSKYAKENNIELGDAILQKDGSYMLVDANGKITGYKGKRIYTIDEANLVAKPTGNTIRIKYR